MCSHESDVCVYKSGPAGQHRLVRKPKLYRQAELMLVPLHPCFYFYYISRTSPLFIVYYIDNKYSYQERYRLSVWCSSP